MAQDHWYEATVADAARGDVQAFGRLVDHYYPLVRGLAASRVTDWQGAEDVAQEVFLLVWRNLGNLKNPAAFPFWIRRITRNAAMDWLRKKQYRTQLQEARREMAAALHSDSPLPGADMGTEERFAKLRVALEQVSPKLSEALALYYFEDMNVTEAAEALGVARETMKKRLQLGRKALRTMLEKSAPELAREFSRPEDIQAKAPIDQ